MKIDQLPFVSAEPIAKTLTLGDTEHTVYIKQISFGDMEKIGSSTLALLSTAVVFDDNQTLTPEQAARLDVPTAAALLALVNEVNSPKA